MYFGSHKTFQVSGGLRENGRVVNDRVGSPHERHAKHLAVHAHQWQGSELRGKLGVAGDFGRSSGAARPAYGDRSGHVARRRNHVIISGAAAAQFRHQFIARSHVGSGDFAVMLLFERSARSWDRHSPPTPEGSESAFSLRTIRRARSRPSNDNRDRYASPTYALPVHASRFIVHSDHLVYDHPVKTSAEYLPTRPRFLLRPGFFQRCGVALSK